MTLGESLVGQLRGQSREDTVDWVGRDYLIPAKMRRKPVVTQATAAPRRRRRKPNRIAKIASSLWDKLISGKEAAGLEPGDESIIPYAKVPKKIREYISPGEAFVGWDVRKLQPEEYALLQRMISIDEQAFK